MAVVTSIAVKKQNVRSLTDYVLVGVQQYDHTHELSGVQDIVVGAQLVLDYCLPGSKYINGEAWFEKPDETEGGWVVSVEYLLC